LPPACVFLGAQPRDRRMKKPLRVGFMGFGEAAWCFGRDLARAGLDGLVAYSRSGARAAAKDPLRRRAAQAGVELVATPRELCRRADVIIALTPGKTALSALRSALPHLERRHLYVDASSAAVKTMERAAALLEGRAGFVDAAIMGPVPLNGIRVLTVASGPAARRFHALLAPYGMNIRPIGGDPGAASAMKLIRSVCMKGLSAVLIESLEAAHRRGILDFVAGDIAGSFAERPFPQIMQRLVCGTAVHAERRVHEMTDVLALLRDLGAPARMTRATRAKLMDVAAMGLRERFGGREPDSIARVLQAMAAAGRR
jgi:3-hydroxyisobutyrate dehydrogenase-like beta-hydroxyacid dehydrogenase